MALADNRPVGLMASTNRSRREVELTSEPGERSTGSLVTATAWAAVGLAAIAVVGLIVAPSLRPAWIIVLLLAVAAVPQAVLRARRERRDRTRP